MSDEPIISPEMRDAFYRHSRIQSSINELLAEIDAMEDSPMVATARKLVQQSVDALAQGEVDAAEQYWKEAESQIRGRS